MFRLVYLIALSLLACSCNSAGQPAERRAADTSGELDVRGLSFVAPPAPFSGDPMQDVREQGAGWIAVIPYAYSPSGKPLVRYNATGWQWWGERPEGVAETIRLAHRAGIRVMLKPQVYVPGGWTGGIDFATEAEWNQWEEGYERYLMRFAHMADSLGAEALCIGTEFKSAVVRREKFWRGLIANVRSHYKGLLTYSANWDEYPVVPFWNELDFVGINAYFPIAEGDAPTPEQLRAGWAPYVEQMAAFQGQCRKPIVFTEYGYLSVSGCAYKGWELERKITTLPVNEQAQANALDALWDVMHRYPWWKGGFLWKWFPHMQGHEGYPERDYTPQGKLAGQVIRKWYRR